MAGLLLKTVQYSEHSGRSNEWSLDTLTLGPVNLLVGRNATGKTRALNVIGNFARLFVHDQHFRSLNGHHKMQFTNGQSSYEYIANIDEGKVVHEELNIDGQNYLVRERGGKGEIFFHEEKKKQRFQPPEKELAAVARRDALQHPYLEPLHEWAQAVRHYNFGTTLGKDHLGISVKEAPETDDRDSNLVVAIFKKAISVYGKDFTQAVISDMSKLNYDIENIDLCSPKSIQVLSGGMPKEVLVLGVKEKGVNGIVEQIAMSQGMFRALSILIQVNYSQMARRANTILIDDIGEGLDFERSTSIIDILRIKAKASEFQLVMTTNDRFVMNQVPLEEWSILQRNVSKVSVRNHMNSKLHFDSFKFMGLNNFDFLKYNFIDEDMSAITDPVRE